MDNIIKDQIDTDNKNHNIVNNNINFVNNNNYTIINANNIYNNISPNIPQAQNIKKNKSKKSKKSHLNNYTTNKKNKINTATNKSHPDQINPLHTKPVQPQYILPKARENPLLFTPATPFDEIPQFLSELNQVKSSLKPTTKPLKPLKSNSSQIKDYSSMTLDEICHNLSAISKRQNGCRFLQKVIDSPYSELNKNYPLGNDIVNNYFYPSLSSQTILELCTDFFANYFIQKIIEHLNIQNLVKISSLLYSYFLKLSCDPHGTRVIQSFNKRIFSHDELISKFVKIMTPYLMEIIKNHNGCFVIYNFFILANEEHRNFIYDFILQNIVEIATSSNSCSILQKIIDLSDEKTKKKILNSIASFCMLLVTNENGNYVLQFVLDKNDKEINNNIAKILSSKILVLSKQKYSSNVIEKCIDLCYDDVRNDIIKMIKNEKAIKELLFDMYGNYVLQKIIMYCGEEDKKYFLGIVVGEIKNLSMFPFGPKLIFKLMLSFPELRNSLNVNNMNSNDLLEYSFNYVNNFNNNSVNQLNNNYQNNNSNNNSSNNNNNNYLLGILNNSNSNNQLNQVNNNNKNNNFINNNKLSIWNNYFNNLGNF